jgi:flavin-dependent dehydrogenase
MSRRHAETPPADVLIVGAGTAGAAAAHTLAAGHSVVLVDRHAEPPFRIGESLIGAARPLLADMGLWARFAGDRHRESLGQASAWGSPEIVRRDAFLDPRGPGWRIDRVRFERMLRQAAAEAGATIEAPGEVVRLDRDDDPRAAWVASIRSPRGTWRQRARFVIDATGRAAAFARAAGARLVAPDRLVCRFVRVAAQQAPHDLDGVSLVEAAAPGWWYRARLPDGSIMVAFHTDADLPAARRSRDVPGFVGLLGETAWTAAATPLAHVPAKWMPVRRREHAPTNESRAYSDSTGTEYALRGACDAVGRVSARSQWLREPCGADWCAVGDAAMAFDPLSSQGLFNALYTGFRGAQAVAARLAGETAALAAYRDRLVLIRDAYARNRVGYYAQERRFRDQPFWQRRQAVAA